MNVIEFRSEQSPTVIYACSSCRYTALDQAMAEACCRCPNCGMAVKGPGRQTCSDCRAKAYREQDAARRAKELALPVVEDKGEPVLIGSTFYEDVHAAAEAVWDDGDDSTEVVAFPCTVAKVGTPSIAEFVEEAWLSNFDDPDVADMPKAAADLCDELQPKLEALAPTVWIPRINERVLLPQVRQPA